MPEHCRWIFKKKLDFKEKAMKTLYVHLVNACWASMLSLAYLMMTNLVYIQAFTCSLFGGILQTTTDEHKLEQVTIRSAQLVINCVAPCSHNSTVQKGKFFEKLETNSRMLPLQAYLKRKKYRARHS